MRRTSPAAAGASGTEAVSGEEFALGTAAEDRRTSTAGQQHSITKWIYVSRYPIIGYRSQTPKEFAMSEKSIYEQIGGDPAVDAAVDAFYRKVLVDERISQFFDDVDMDRQAAKQKAFLTMVMGGPASYTGRDMRQGHQHLIARGLNDEHVNAVIELLG